MEILDLNNEEDTKTTDEMEPKKPEEKTSPVKEILSWVLTIAFAIVAAILIKNYVIINANIPSGSMENTIQIGDDIFGFRLAYTFSDPKRGDIVIFNAPDSPSEKYIKRVIGLPGETVTIEDGQVYIDGEALEEDYLKSNQSGEDPWTVNAGPYEFKVHRTHICCSVTTEMAHQTQESGSTHMCPRTIYLQKRYSDITRSTDSER